MPTGKLQSEGASRLPPDTRRKGGVFARAVGSYVPKVAAKAFEKYGFHTAEIMTQWPRIVGRDLALWTRPERLKWPRPAKADCAQELAEARPGGVLHLRVEPARALDVEYRAREIVDRINRYFGYRAVESLRLIQAPLEQAPLAPAPLQREEQTHPAAASAAPLAILSPARDLDAALVQLEASVRRSRAR